MPISSFLKVLHSEKVRLGHRGLVYISNIGSSSLSNSNHEKKLANSGFST